MNAQALRLEPTAFGLGDIVTNGRVAGPVIGLHGPWVWMDAEERGPLTFHQTDLRHGRPGPQPKANR